MTGVYDFVILASLLNREYEKNQKWREWERHCHILQEHLGGIRRTSRCRKREERGKRVRAIGGSSRSNCRQNEWIEDLQTVDKAWERVLGTLEDFDWSFLQPMSKVRHHGISQRWETFKGIVRAACDTDEFFSTSRRLVLERAVGKMLERLILWMGDLR